MSSANLTAEAVSSKILDLAAEFAKPEAGQVWRARSGDLVTIKRVNSFGAFPVISTDGNAYRRDGVSCMSVGFANGGDLIDRVDVQGPKDGNKAADGGPVGEHAPKLVPADIEAVIVAEQYFTAEHGINGAMVRGQLHGAVKSSVHMGSLAHVTYCVLLLRNGAKVTGVNHGPVSAANFNAEQGRKMARENAIEKVWELEGYALREKLMASPVTLNLSEEQGRELMETLKSLKPCDLVPGGQATDGGPNPHYDPDADKGAQLLDIMRAFVYLYRVSCPETIHQTDRVIEKAGGLIEKLCDVAGYYRDPDDEAEEAQP